MSGPNTKEGRFKPFKLPIVERPYTRSRKSGNDDSIDTVTVRPEVVQSSCNDQDPRMCEAQLKKCERLESEAKKERARLAALRAIAEREQQRVEDPLVGVAASIVETVGADIEVDESSCNDQDQRAYEALVKKCDRLESERNKERARLAALQGNADRERQRVINPLVKKSTTKPTKFQELEKRYDAIKGDLDRDRARIQALRQEKEERDIERERLLEWVRQREEWERQEREERDRQEREERERSRREEEQRQRDEEERDREERNMYGRDRERWLRAGRQQHHNTSHAATSFSMGQRSVYPRYEYRNGGFSDREIAGAVRLQRRRREKNQRKKEDIKALKQLEEETRRSGRETPLSRLQRYRFWH